MKYKIEELKDITDSREIMQSSPKGFSKYMTYIIIALLIMVIVWSLIAHKEVSVRASGVVRPSDEITKISSGIIGNITNLNIKDGDKVKKDDILVVVNGAEHVLQRDLLQENLDRKNKEVDKLSKLKQCILDGENRFDPDNEEEKEYYKKYQLYTENLKASDNQEELYEQQKDEIESYISDLELLKKGVEEEKNYFNEKNTLYYQYNDYIMGMNNYRDVIKIYENKIEELQLSINETNKEQIKSEIATLNDNIINSKKEMDKLKNTSLMNVSSEISKNKSKLSQVGTVSSTGSYKEQYISNIESNIANVESNIADIKMNLEVATEKVNATSIKAPCDGVINMLSEVKIGDFIQNGSEIASIVPEDDSNFKVEVYIDNQSFGEIKEGQDVMIELVSLPGREYGYLKSNLKNISVDAKVSQEKGISYYTASCPIQESELKNRKGECIGIKNGMLAEVRIVNREVSYFRYFLEKIDILD